MASKSKDNDIEHEGSIESKHRKTWVVKSPHYEIVQEERSQANEKAGKKEKRQANERVLIGRV